MEPFLGQLMLVPYNFAPRNWAFCEGQLLPISQYSALFSLLGTNFGGDGRTTFGLPDLRGRVALGAGQGPGLSNYVLGEKAGQEQVTLLASQIPAHAHAASTQSASESNPTANVPAFVPIYSKTADAALAPSGGQSGAHENRQPFLVLNYVIALQGIFPSRS